MCVLAKYQIIKINSINIVYFACMKAIRASNNYLGIIISVPYMLYLLCLLTNDRDGMLEPLTVFNIIYAG